MNLFRFIITSLLGKNVDTESYISTLHQQCLLCEKDIHDSDTYSDYKVCPYCRFHYTLSARERIELLADHNSFRESHKFLSSVAPLSFSNKKQYQDLLSKSQTKTGLTEAVVTGRSKIEGLESMLIVLDFGFMGGSMGSVVGEKVALALEDAAKRDIPTVALVTGGGARIQEGVMSLMQMAKTVSAANRLREKDIPFIVVLANPSTGQAYASFANLADVILAEPGSLIGLSPLRTLRNVSDTEVPFSAHTAEAHLNNGLIDNIVDRENLQPRIASLLAVLTNQKQTNKNIKQAIKLTESGANNESSSDPIATARHAERPSSLYYMRSMLQPFIELHGDRLNSDCRSIVGGIGSLHGKSVAIIGQQRTAKTGQSAYHTYPDGLRKAQRIIKLATKFNLPLITLIDTEGADPGIQAEEQGIGNAIAGTLALMAEVPIPIISAIIGESGSEGALALGISDRILMQEYAIYSPVAVSSITSTRRPTTSEILQKTPEDFMLTSPECSLLGLVDTVVNEPSGGSHNNPQDAADALKIQIMKSLLEIERLSSSKLLRERYKKYRKMGEMSTYAQEAVNSEIQLLINLANKNTSIPNTEVVHTNIFDEYSKILPNTAGNVELPEGT